MRVTQGLDGRAEVCADVGTCKRAKRVNTIGEVKDSGFRQPDLGQPGHNAQHSLSSIPASVLLTDSMAAPRCAAAGPTCERAKASQDHRRRSRNLVSDNQILANRANAQNSKAQFPQGCCSRDFDGHAGVCADGPACKRATTSQYHRGRSRIWLQIDKSRPTAPTPRRVRVRKRPLASSHLRKMPAATAYLLRSC